MGFKRVLKRIGQGAGLGAVGGTALGPLGTVLGAVGGGAIGLVGGGAEELFGGSGSGEGDPALRGEIAQGYRSPQETAAYRAMQGEIAKRAAEQRSMTQASYAGRGLGQSGYATAAGQQVGLNESRALQQAIAQIQMQYLEAALGIRGQDLAAQAAREQAMAQMLGSGINAAGNIGAAFI